MQFLLIGGFECFRIAFHRIQADENIAGNLVSACIIEGDDIGVIIMFQILAVHFQNLLV